MATREVLGELHNSSNSKTAWQAAGVSLCCRVGWVPLLQPHSQVRKGLAVPEASAAAVEQSGFHTSGGFLCSDVVGCSSAIDSCSATGMWPS